MVRQGLQNFVLTHHGMVLSSYQQSSPNHQAKDIAEECHEPLENGPPNHQRDAVRQIKRQTKQPTSHHDIEQ
jgi:hypothetical protein